MEDKPPEGEHTPPAVPSGVPGQTPGPAPGGEPGAAPSRPPTDYRRDRGRLDRQLAWAVVIFLVGVGGLLITLRYGFVPAIAGITCLAAGAAIFGLLWLILTLIGRWVGDD